MSRKLRFAVFIYILAFVCILFWLISTTGSRSSTQEDFVGVIEYEQTIRSNTGNVQQHSKDKEINGEFSCNGEFVGYEHTFAKLKNVLIDPQKGKGRRGGENFTDIFNQPEENEYYTLAPGYFRLCCMDKKHYAFNKKSHVSRWLEVLEFDEILPKFSAIHHDWTIAIVRYEYVNLYHTMTDFYNAFIVAKQFEMHPGNITILWIDGHPSGALDSTWVTLFGKVLRAGDIKAPEMFNRMVWGIMGYDSQLNYHYNKQVPYLDEFRSFFLSRHGIETNSNLNCSKLKIVFLWRRDYLAHPRNPSGSVSRKIKNEQELLESANKTFPNHGVFGVQIDKLKMSEQLELIAGVDILIGMHGAGLSHTLFLPKHAGLIELYPTYWSNSNRHFMSMARWRKLNYLSWVNADRTKELPNHYTAVDVDIVINLIAKTKQKICN